MADALKRKPTTLGVDLLFDDGEDYGDFDKTPMDVLMGARYYAAHQVPGPQPLYAVLWDLVADKDLQLYQEGNSLVGAPEVVEPVWETAREMGEPGHFIAIPNTRSSTIISSCRRPASALSMSWTSTIPRGTRPMTR